jgi:hypothetical protein
MNLIYGGIIDMFFEPEPTTPACLLGRRPNHACHENYFFGGSRTMVQV